MAFLEFGQFGQPGGLVDRVADHRVLETGLRADMAGDGAPGRYPDAELRGTQHREEFVVQLTGGRQCATGCVRVFDWCAEDRQRGIALELVDEPAMAADGVDHHAEELVEQVDHLGGRSRRGQLGGADQVHEQHRDVALLPAQFGAALQGPAGHVFADVATEQVTQPLPLGQVTDHVVEARLQQAQFARVVDLHVRVVVAALHLG